MSAKGSKTVGLDREQVLPEGFSAKTDMKARKVEIAREGRKPVKIGMNSFASVANVLSGLWPDGNASLEPGSPLTIEDRFTGRQATVVAAAVQDVAIVLKGLVTKPGRYVPDQKKTPRTRKAATVPVRKSIVESPSVKEMSEGSDVKEGTERQRITREAEKQVAAKEEAVVSKTVAPARKRATRKAPVSAGPSGKMPTWFRKGFADRLEFDDGAGGMIELRRMALALEGAGFKNVIGPSKGIEDNIAWGYDVRFEDSHVAWVVALPKEGFVITGVEGIEYPASTHKVMDGVIGRLAAIVVPKYLAAKAA